jgi:UDP-N-acetyl-D-glucosamine dehydrogenase
VIPPTRENSAWAGQRSVAWAQPDLAAADAVVVTTAHRGVDYRALLEWSGCVIDTRNAIRAAFGGDVPAALADRLWQA